MKFFMQNCLEQSVSEIFANHRRVGSYDSDRQPCLCKVGPKIQGKLGATNPPPFTPATTRTDFDLASISQIEKFVKKLDRLIKSDLM
jgi:hypothetical protein